MSVMAQALSATSARKVSLGMKICTAFFALHVAASELFALPVINQLKIKLPSRI